MTRVRKLAVWVSKWVCRNAPAGAREWGSASERELEHIESDWEALRWAIGSTTLLLAGKRSAAGVTSLAQVPLLARCVARQVRMRTLLCFAIVFAHVTCWTFLFQAVDSRTLKAAICLMTVCLTIIVIQAYLRRWRGSPDPADARSLRIELARQREFHAGGWLALRLYSAMPSFLMLSIAVWSSEKSLSNAFVALGCASFFACALTWGTKLQLRTAAAFQRQIDALDALAATDKPDTTG
jgi:hypothetical protein